ncbi:MAG: hypothetical protein HEEMFOPI_00829 [Holosporales bacterium]
MIFKKASFLAFSLCFITQAVDAKTSPIQRSIVLTPGYAERTFNSNEMIKYFPLSIMQYSSYACDVTMGLTDNIWVKSLVGGVFASIHYLFSDISQTVYHEFGHARAFESLGGSYHYGVPIDRNSHYRANNVFSLYALILKKHALYESKGALTSCRLLRPLTVKQDLVVSAAGLNNQMRLSQEVADLIDNNNGHVLYAIDYMLGKISAHRYADITEIQQSNGTVSTGNDIDAIIKRYADMGIVVSTSDIKKGSLMSLGLSATTWTFIYSMIKNLRSGMVIESPVWHKWRLPDVNFYITSKGLSYEVITGYHLNDHWYLGLSTEFVYKGNNAFEISPFCVYQFENKSGYYKIKSQTTISQKFDVGASFGLDWMPHSKRWGLGAKYICHNASTLLGERNIPFVKNGNINHEIAATFSFYF